MDTDAKRLQQILKNLLSNAFKFTERGTVSLRHRARSTRAGARTTSRSTARDSVIAFTVTRHRHRHPAGEAADHLRGVPAGGRLDEPQVRRHGPGPGDQPRARPAARRRDPAREHARRGQHVHALPAADVRPARSRAATGGGRAAFADRHDHAGRGRGPRRRSRVARRSTRSPDDAFADDSATSTRRPRPAHRRERHQLRALPVRHGARATASRRVVGLAGVDGLSARPRAWPPAAITLDINLPDIDGWRVLDRLKDDQPRATSPCRSSPPMRKPPARPAHGRDGRPHQADQEQGDARRDVRADQKAYHPAARRGTCSSLTADPEIQRTSSCELIGGDDVEFEPRHRRRPKRSARSTERPFDCVVLELDSAGHRGLRPDRRDPAPTRGRRQIADHRSTAGGR